MVLKVCIIRNFIIILSIIPFQREREREKERKRKREREREREKIEE